MDDEATLGSQGYLFRVGRTKGQLSNGKDVFSAIVYNTGCENLGSRG